VQSHVIALCYNLPMQLDLLASHIPELPHGARLWRDRIALSVQYEMLDAIAGILASAPPFRPRMRNDVAMINAISNCGNWGWLSDAKGYRYEPEHPQTRAPWPKIPDMVLDAAKSIASTIGFPDYEPDACLINIYERSGKLNLHRDEDEEDFRWPIVSFSFGADALFALGGLKRTDRTIDFTLCSGDVLALWGESRMRYHGVKKIGGHCPVFHPVLPLGGRINLTLRRAK
jgi:alkylated DNA repair protein (DNA oxidative demethylase)